MLLEQRTLFQQYFSVKYLHRKPIGFVLLRLIYHKKRSCKQLCDMDVELGQLGIGLTAIIQTSKDNCDSTAMR